MDQPPFLGEDKTAMIDLPLSGVKLPRTGSEGLPNCSFLKDSFSEQFQTSALH